MADKSLKEKLNNLKAVGEELQDLKILKREIERDLEHFEKQLVSFEQEQNEQSKLAADKRIRIEQLHASIAEAEGIIADLETSIRDALTSDPDSQLLKRLGGLLSQRDTKAKELTDLQGELQSCQSQIESANNRIKWLNSENGRIIGLRKNLKDQLYGTLNELDEKKAQYVEAFDSFEVNIPHKLPPEVIESIVGRPQSSNDILTMKTQSIDIDPLASGVLASLAEEVAGAKFRKDLINDLLKAGVASDVAAVTTILSRRRLSQMRLMILNAVYPKLLKEQVTSGGVKLKAGVAKDHVGLASNIVASLEEKGGALDKFAEKLATAALSKMGISDPSGTRDAIVQAQIRNAL
jgi:predicted  nucleic acid-binding Zn-ribbon protein